MAGMEGADPEELDGLAQRFRVFAGRLDSSRASLGSQVHNSPWSGPAADGFRHDWDAHHSPVLSAVARSLGQAADSLVRNADQQRQASGSAFTSTSGAGGGTSPGSGSATGILDAIGHVAEAGAVVGSITTLLGNSGDLLQVPFLELSPGAVTPLLKDGEEVVSSNGNLLSGAASVLGIGVTGSAFVYDLASGQNMETTTLDGAQTIGAAVGVLSPEVGAAIGDGSKLMDDIYAKKSAEQDVWDGANLAVDAVPEAALAKEAFVGGMAIGFGIAQIPAVKTSISDFNDGVFAAGAKAVGGNPNSDPAAAARLVARYSSNPVGVFNYMSDSSSAFLTKIGIL